MKTLMERDLNAIPHKSSQPNKKARGIIWVSRTLRKYLLALIALAILSPCLLSKTIASASDFDLYLQDKESGDDLFVNFATGDYLFFNGKKQGFVAGKGKVTVSDCAMELNDSGPNRKRPDRQVHVFFNPCDNVVEAVCQVFDSGESYAIKDTAPTSQTHVSASANSETAAPVLAIRFDGFCLEDDSKNYALRLTGNFYSFVDRRKGFEMDGIGHLTVNGCKIKFTHDGPDPKRPDRRIYAEFNTCTREASASVWVASTGQTYMISDSHTADSDCSHKRND